MKKELLAQAAYALEAVFAKIFLLLHQRQGWPSVQPPSSSAAQPTQIRSAQARRQGFTVVDTPVLQATGTDGAYAHGGVNPNVDYDVPAIVRKGRSTTVEALANSGVDRYDIPAFLRKQAD